MNKTITDLRQRVLHQLQTIYAEIDLQESLDQLSERLLEIMEIEPRVSSAGNPREPLG